VKIKTGLDEGRLMGLAKNKSWALVSKVLGSKPQNELFSNIFSPRSNKVFKVIYKIPNIKTHRSSIYSI
jgi:hypothetical protein